MDFSLLNTDPTSHSSITTQTLKASRKLPDLDLNCFLDDSPARKINLYTKHAVSPARNRRKVSKRSLPLISPSAEDRSVETSPGAEVEGAKDDLELSLKSEYLYSEETTSRKCSSPVVGSFIRDMVERFDKQSQSVSRLQDKTSGNMSQENCTNISKKFTDNSQTAGNAHLMFHCDGSKNISQRARSQSETVGNIDKKVHHSKRTKPTTAPKPKFYMHNTSHAADCKAESLASLLTKSNKRCSKIASPCESESANNSNRRSTSLTDSLLMLTRDNAKQILVGNCVTGCDAQKLRTTVTDVDISSGSTYLDGGIQADDGDWEDIETSESSQKQVKKKTRRSANRSSSSSAKKSALKKSLNEKVTRAPSSREGTNQPNVVIYVNETESQKDQITPVCNSDHSVSGVAIDTERNKVLIESMRNTSQAEDLSGAVSDQQLPTTNDDGPSDISRTTHSDSDELVYEILPFGFSNREAQTPDSFEPIYELSSSPKRPGVSTLQAVTDDSSSLLPQTFDSEDIPQIPARPSTNPSPIGSPRAAPRKSSKGHINVSKLTQVVLPPSPVPGLSLGSSPTPPVTIPRVPPRLGQSQNINSPSTPVPGVLPRKSSNAQTVNHTKSRRLPPPPMPPPLPESMSSDDPTLPGSLDVPILPQRNVRCQDSVSLERVATGRSTARRPSTGVLKGYEFKCVEVDSGNPSRLSSKSSLSNANSHSMNDLLKTESSRCSTLSLHIPAPSADDSDLNQPISPSRSEGYLKQGGGDGYLPMGSQRMSAISSRFSSTSELLEQNLSVDSNGFPIIPPRQTMHRFSSAATPLDRAETRTPNLEKFVKRDNSYLELSQDDDYKYAYLSLYAECEPYQIYHQTAVVRQVIEQNMDTDSDYDNYYSPQEYVEHAKSCVNDILKRDSGNELLDSKKVIRGLSTLESAARLGTGFRKLWSEMPKVKESGLLDHMTPDERRLQESTFEILSSEASYLKSLNLLVGHFMEMLAIDIEDKEKHHVVTKQDFNWLFSNAKAVRDACIKTLEALENLWQDGCVLNPLRLCSTITEVVQEHYGVYVTYCSNASYQERKLRELNERSAEFRYAIRRLEDSADCHSLPLHSFLALPMQRITRLPLLVSAMCRYLKPDDASSPEVTRCIQTLQKVVKQCNEGARKMSNLEQMSKIEKVLDFRSVKKVPIISQSRFLVKKGVLVQIINQPSGFLKKSKRTLFFYLFNDLLIVTKKKSEKQFEVLEYCLRSRIHTETIRDEDLQRFLPYGAPSGCRNLFNMVLLDKGVEFVLSCESQSEQQRWIQAVTPVEHTAGEDVIYMDWDCPQVQAVMQYSATEPDELSLEESDIINVLCKETDGWYEGERIRDGERGWFPAHCTVEIQNEHVRARNLRQQYQLMKKSTSSFSVPG